jgi:glucose-1-phosphate adenylyltransferase
MKVLTIVLAGGAGERLSPLANRAKPFLLFGGVYRLIDITLSNCINSKLHDIRVLTQNGGSGLNWHLRRVWNPLPDGPGKTVEILSPSRGGRYSGTADAVYRNLDRLQGVKADFVLVLSADHVCRMDYRRMLDWHIGHNAEVTVATMQVAPSESHRFGVVEMNSRHSITGFKEKPQPGDAARSVLDPEACSASMGVYFFNAGTLFNAVLEDARDGASAHDFGQNVLPRLVGHARMTAYNFSGLDNCYWRDVGTVDSYYDAHMDLVSTRSPFDLYEPGWPIRTDHTPSPPARFAFSEFHKRTGMALDSLVSNGCVVTGARVRRSVLSANVTVGSLSDVDRAVVLPRVRIGDKCRIYRAIIDEGITLPDGTDIGVDLDTDRRAGRYVSSSGVVVVTALPAALEPETEVCTRASA